MRCFLSVLVVGLLGYAEPASAQNDTVNVRVVHGTCDTVLPLARLKQLPAHTVVVAGHDGEQSTYRGALLFDVLGAGCTSVSAASKRERIGMVVRAEADDDYHVVVALMEADTSFRDKPVLVCYEKNGQPLDAHDGPMQLIVPDDKRHARNVRGLKELKVLMP